MTFFSTYIQVKEQRDCWSCSTINNLFPHFIDIFFYFLFFVGNFRYGPIFRTSLAGRPVVISSDPEFNYYVFQQEGKLVERWYMDSFAKLLHQDAARINGQKNIHKYLRNLILGHFGPEVLKEKMLPKLEDAINQKMHGWSKLSSFELKDKTSAVSF